MKCPKCNREIIVDINFCPFCGSELGATSSNEKASNEEKEAQNIKQQPQVEIIKIGTDKISINNYMRMECQELIEVISIAYNFADRVYKIYKLADSLDRGTSRLKEIIEEEYPEIAQKIIDMEGKISFQVDISGQQLCELSSQYIHSLKNIVLLSEAKSFSLEQKDAYNKFKRDINKESRFRIIGGGFGIKGALEGMAIAGAVNQTTGAFYSLFNGIKDIGDNISSNMDKFSLYNNLKDKVFVAVYNDVVQTYYFLNYLIKRPMKYEMFTGDVHKLFENGIKKYSERQVALSLIVRLPYLKESFEIAAQSIAEKEDLLIYAQKIGNNDAVIYLKKIIKEKESSNNFFEDDADLYSKLFGEKNFFKKLINEKVDVATGVQQLSWQVNKVHAINDPHIIKPPVNMNEDEFFVCPIETGDNIFICTNTGIHFINKEKNQPYQGEYISYQKISYFDYKMTTKEKANICINNRPIASVELNEKDATGLVDCMNYVVFKIKYRIPKVFPDNFMTACDKYNKKLTEIFGQNKDYIVDKYKKEYVLDMFLNIDNNEDLIDTIEREIRKMKWSDSKYPQFQLACKINDYENYPAIVDSVSDLVYELGYVFENKEVICFAYTAIGNYNWYDYQRPALIIVTTEGLYFIESEDGTVKYVYYNYTDIKDFELKFKKEYSSFNPKYYINKNESCIDPPLSSWGLSHGQIYDVILYIILSIKYKKDVKYKRTVRLDDYKEQLLKYAKKKAEKEKKKEKGGCFITTATCVALGKDDDCYELNSFRYFRDEWLAKQINGQYLIDEYYKIAPTIVKTINKNIDRASIYKSIWDNYLKLCLSAIEKKDYEECKSIYINMVKTLYRLFGN